ncbi:hypothetical protein HKT18_09500 [Flavobacterium sp. IMCC34852]|uniref:Uncharacterized protein n=1 Tax=Flavobacterium rivulicola TaxID=2732161 RepID=A0A7Y3R9J7_9FLAO|nr:hypothetical protein [Flavobacterium sp. IMCC34852]NNT72448.1 hypothetical protein [Flavobacterium sp. IMCC34852]
MEANQTEGNKFLAFVKKETRKPAFRKALLIFFICTILGFAIGFIFNMLQLAASAGIGFGLIWMGAAYFGQDENEK